METKVYVVTAGICKYEGPIMTTIGVFTSKTEAVKYAFTYMYNKNFIEASIRRLGNYRSWPRGTSTMVIPCQKNDDFEQINNDLVNGLINDENFDNFFKKLVSVKRPLLMENASNLWSIEVNEFTCNIPGDNPINIYTF